MTIKQPKQKAGAPTLVDKLKRRKASDVAPLEKLIFAVCTWKPMPREYVAGKVRQVSDIERAHLRTQKLLANITFKLLAKQAVFNFKRRLYAISKKA